MVDIAILGVSGQMGRTLIAELGDDPQWRLAGALCAPGNDLVGRSLADLAPVATRDGRVSQRPIEAVGSARVAVDFTLATVTPAIIAACVEVRCPLVLCTTGLGPDAEHEIDEAARQIPILVAANTSLGVAVITRLAELAAAALGPDFDAEIAEAHHRHKKDAPSGTALQLGRAIASARGAEIEELAQFREAGKFAQRRAGSVGFSSIRGGDIAGEHTVLFAGQGERLEITHRVASRRTFARGALRAASWLVGRDPGRYSMGDVLALQFADRH